MNMASKQKFALGRGLTLEQPDSRSAMDHQTRFRISASRGDILA